MDPGKHKRVEDNSWQKLATIVVLISGVLLGIHSLGLALNWVYHPQTAQLQILSIIVYGGVGLGMVGAEAYFLKKTIWG